MKGAELNLEKCLLPIIWINRIIGMAFFESPKNHFWIKLSIVYIICLSSAFGYFFWTARELSYKNTDRDLDIPITTAVLEFNKIVGVSIAIVTVLFGLYNSKKRQFSKFIKRVTLLDETLSIFKVNPNYVEERKKIINLINVWGISWLGSYIIIIAIRANSLNSITLALYKVTIFQIPLIISSIGEMNILSLFVILQKRFEQINILIKRTTMIPLNEENLKLAEEYKKKFIKNQKEDIYRSNYYHQNLNNILLLLKTLRQLHLELCNLCREVNDSYSKQILTQMAAAFIFLIGFTYSIYHYYNEPYLDINIKINHFEVFSLRVMLKIIRMTYVFHVFVKIVNESKKASQIAQEIELSPKILIDEISHFALQTIQHPLYLHACGLFLLDFAYIRRFFGSVTTYSLIMIQNQPGLADVLGDDNLPSNVTSVNRVDVV